MRQLPHSKRVAYFEPFNPRNAMCRTSEWETARQSLLHTLHGIQAERNTHNRIKRHANSYWAQAMQQSPGACMPRTADYIRNLVRSPARALYT